MARARPREGAQDTRGHRTESLPPRSSCSSKGTWTGSVETSELAKSLQTVQQGNGREKAGGFGRASDGGPRGSGRRGPSGQRPRGRTGFVQDKRPVCRDGVTAGGPAPGLAERGQAFVFYSKESLGSHKMKQVRKRACNFHVGKGRGAGARRREARLLLGPAVLSQPFALFATQVLATTTFWAPGWLSR